MQHVLRTLAARGAAALAATLPVAAAEQRTSRRASARRRKRCSGARAASSLQRRNSRSSGATPRRRTTATPPAKPKPQPTPNAAPRVGVFLASRSSPRARQGEPDGIVLDEGLENDQMYGSLYGEKATVRIVGADSGGALRGLVCDGTEVKASGSTTAVLKLVRRHSIMRNRKPWRSRRATVAKQTAVKWDSLPRRLLEGREMSRGAFIKMSALSVHGLRAPPCLKCSVSTTPKRRTRRLIKRRKRRTSRWLVPNPLWLSAL